MISRSISEIARRVDSEQTDFRAAAFVAVADHGHCIFRDQHLVVPGVARIDLRAERIRHRNRLQCAAANRHREQAPAPQHDQMIAVQLDDIAFVNAGVLRVGD